MFSEVMNPTPVAMPAMANARGESINTDHVRIQRSTGTQKRQVRYIAGIRDSGKLFGKRQTPRITTEILDNSSANPMRIEIGMNAHSCDLGCNSGIPVSSRKTATKIDTVAPRKKYCAEREKERKPCGFFEARIVCMRTRGRNDADNATKAATPRIPELSKAWKQMYIAKRADTVT